MNDMNAVAERLQAWLNAQGIQGQGVQGPQATEGVQVRALQSASGGYSNITLLGELHGPAQPQAIVVRIQPEGAAVFPDCDVQAQYRTMQLLQGSGLPVPPLDDDLH